MYKKLFDENHDRKIIDTRHALERIAQRYSHISKERINKVVQDAIDKIIKEYNDEATTYGVWSKSTGIGILIDWRLEKIDKNGLNHAVIVTTFPIKKNINDLHLDQKDTRLIVEKSLEASLTTIQLKEAKDPKILHYIEVKLNNHSMFFEQGKMFDSGIAFCLEVK